MLDDLDLAWEEQYEPRRRPSDRRGHPPSRQIRQRKRKERKRRRRSFGALLVSIVLLAALGFGVYWGVGKVQDFLTAPDYTATGTEQVTVQVKDGETLTDIANTLYQADVVKSAKAFVNAAKENPQESKNIHVGYYRLYRQMPAAAALAMLLDPAKNRIVNGVTIPEGLTAVDIYAKLSKATNIPVKEFTAVGKNPEDLLGDYADIWFTRDDGKAVAKSIEGFLYPDTYEFGPDDTAEQILQQMVNRFFKVAQDLQFVQNVNKSLHISPYEALIAASIAQAEAKFPEDFKKVSRVLYNRAYSGDFACSCLGMDSTVNYWLKLNGKAPKASEHLTYAQLHDPKNPYNTHDKPGLPPGPIANPGKEALTGAMSPTGGNITYFVTVDKQGHMAYASTLAGHNENRKLACKNGIPIC